MDLLSQRTFGHGQLGKALQGRVDVSLYPSGLTKAQNTAIARQGGVFSRAGFKHVGYVKNQSQKVRLIKFIFNQADTYMLEFGPGYMRVMRNGAVVHEPAKTIQGVTAAAPGVFTITAHGFQTGDDLDLSLVGGMVELNGRRVTAVRIDANTFSVKTVAGVDLDTSAFTAFTAGGIAEKVYEIESPYTAADLPDLNVKGIGNGILIAHRSHPVHVLTRLDHDEWTLAQQVYGPSIAAPGGLAVSGTDGTSDEWVVTAASFDDYEESYATAAVGSNSKATLSAPRTLTWNAVTGAVEYYVYKKRNGIFGYIGTSLELSFTDDGIPVDTSTNPPSERQSLESLGQSIEQLDNPASVPGGVSRAADFHPSGDFLAVAHEGGDSLAIYSKTGDLLVVMDDAAVAPAGNGQAVKWNHAGNKLAVASSSTPYIQVYNWDGETLTKIANGNFTALPPGAATGVDWSADDNYMAVSHARVSSKAFTWYKVTGDNFAKQTDIANADQPTGNATGIAFNLLRIYYGISPTQPLSGGSISKLSSMICVTHETTPFFRLYVMNTTNGTLTRVETPSSLPASTATGCAFHPRGDLLSISHLGGDFLTNYRVTGLITLSFATFFELTKAVTPSNLPPDDARGVAYSKDGIFCAVGHDTTPFLTYYRVVGETFVRQTAPGDLPAGDSNGVAFSPVADYLAVVGDTADYFVWYKLGFSNPGAVGYHQQREWIGSSASQPRVVAGSRVGLPDNFSISFPLTQDDSFARKLDGSQEEMFHFVDNDKLFLITSGEVYGVEGDETGAVGPITFDVRRRAGAGSSRIQPVVADGIIVFCNVLNNKILGFFFNPNGGGYNVTDLTRLNPDLFDGYTIVSMTYQKDPHGTIYCVRNDGVLLGLSFFPEEKVEGWHVHKTGYHSDVIGSDVFQTADQFEWVECTRENGRDVLYASILRMDPDGVGFRMIQAMQDPDLQDEKKLCYVDSSSFYDGRNQDLTRFMSLFGSQGAWQINSQWGDYFVAGDEGDAIILHLPNGTELKCKITNVAGSTIVAVDVENDDGTVEETATIQWSRAVRTVKGLWHMEGQKVAVWADGRVMAAPFHPDYADLVVEDGEITLPELVEDEGPWQAARIWVGLAFRPAIETLEINTAEGPGLDSDPKDVVGLMLRVDRSLGGFAGPAEPTSETEPWGDLVEITKMAPGHTSTIAPFSGKTDDALQGDWNKNGKVFLTNLTPTPWRILGVHPKGFA